MNEIDRIVGIAVAARGEDGEALKTIQISPPGRVESLKGIWELDAENAAEVIAAIEAHGVDVVIDYNHQTYLPEERGASGETPAAGWIKRLHWDETRGLLADVLWTPDATEKIRGDRYRYISPVFFVDKETRRVTEMGVPGLVNAPATPHAERVAASLTPGTQPPPRSNPPSRSSGPRTGLTEQEKRLMDELKKLLIELGVELAEDADVEAIVNAAIAKLKALTEKKKPAEEEGAGEGEQVAASAAICKKLGLPEGSTEQVIATALDKLTGHVGYVPVEQVNTLQEQVNKLQEAESERNAERLVASYLTAGKLNTHDAKQMEWANKAARENPEGFEAIMAGASVIVPQGRTKAPVGSNTPGNNRVAVIASAAREYDAHANERRTAKNCDVNLALRDRGMKPLTDEEIAKL